MVDPSRKSLNPPVGHSFDHTPVWCEYCPVRIDARLGQQRLFGTNALVKVTPWATNRRCTFGIQSSVSQRWSSVRIRRMLGRPGAAEPRPTPLGIAHASDAANTARRRNDLSALPPRDPVLRPVVSISASLRWGRGCGAPGATVRRRWTAGTGE